VHAAAPEPGVPADDDITVPRRTLSAAEALVRARRVSSRRTGAPIIPVVGPLAPQWTATELPTERSTSAEAPPTAAAAATEPLPAESAIPGVAPAASSAAVPAAARSLDRDDIARFYRDLNRPGE